MEMRKMKYRFSYTIGERQRENYECRGCLIQGTELHPKHQVHMHTDTIRLQKLGKCLFERGNHLDNSEDDNRVSM